MHDRRLSSSQIHRATPLHKAARAKLRDRAQPEA
jgi:hypothetical protein